MAERTDEQPIQPPFYVGMPVMTDDGAVGTIAQILTDLPDADGGLRIAWEAGGSVVVPQPECTVEAGHAIVPSEYAAAGDAPAGQSGTDSRARDRTDATAVRGDRVVANEPVTVPIVEERIATEAVWRDAGSVIFHLRTEEVPETVSYEEAREDVVVEEVAVGRELRAGEALTPRTEGDVTIIPVIREEIVLTTRRVLEKEIRVTKRVTRTPRSAEMTVRRQRVEMDGGEASTHVVDMGGPAAETEQG